MKIHSSSAIKRLLGSTAMALCLLGLPAGQLTASGTPFSDLSAHEQLSEDILRELVAFESSEERPGETRKALEAMAARLLGAGFTPEAVQLVNPGEGLFGLVVRYRGIGEARPLLTLAHIDVVTVTPDAWTFPPFSLGVKDGYYLGRGTEDNKAGVTQIISNFIRLKQEGWVPNRDVIAAISGDEETNGAVASWLANEGRDLIDAEFALNSDAGGGEYDEQGQRRAFWVQTSEKLYQTYRLTATNEGGHSSVPRPDNAIRDLAVAITRLSDYAFPVILGNGTRMALRRSAAFYPESVASDMLALADNENDAAAAQRLSAVDPGFNAILRTTCVPTMLSGGHAENALPRDASVTVNCRIIPGTPQTEIEQEIAGLVKDLNIGVETIFESVPSDASEIPDALMERIETMVGDRWGDIPVIPGMSTGATDGLFFRNAGIPVYGISALFSKPGESRSHGLDERIGIREFHESVEFWYQMLKVLAR
jgi:acetylornithine deacetylase/succinyl-diaminopimelate desuccinylase-like protein